MQGQLGDCYFLSSIASIISFYPEVIFDKILFSVNRARYYIVKLFIDGEEKIIITDDQFPCKGNQPVFAQPHGR
jgi:calpain-15